MVAPAIPVGVAAYELAAMACAGIAALWLTLNPPKIKTSPKNQDENLIHRSIVEQATATAEFLRLKQTQDEKDRCNKCPPPSPCDPPVGTVCFRIEIGHVHGECKDRHGGHIHPHVVVRKGDCTCGSNKRDELVICVNPADMEQIATIEAMNDPRCQYVMYNK